MKKNKYFGMRMTLVALGICLGYLARLILGAPAEETVPPRTIDRPLPEKPQRVEEEEVIDLPIELPTIELDGNQPATSGLVPPIHLPGSLPLTPASGSGTTTDLLAHDSKALFEPHGDQICASGCAASRHPTKTLTQAHFEQLLVELTYEPLNQTNNALEELMYFGPQTRQMIETHGVGDLDSQRAEFLWDQLKYDRAEVSIRVLDDSGNVRTWIEPTTVPFDRRHVFEMETNNVQPLVTSGTVKRVGLNHIWARL